MHKPHAWHLSVLCYMVIVELVECESQLYMCSTKLLIQCCLGVPSLSWLIVLYMAAHQAMLGIKVPTCGSHRP